MAFYNHCRSLGDLWDQLACSVWVEEPLSNLDSLASVFVFTRVPSRQPLELLQPGELLSTVFTDVGDELGLRLVEMISLEEYPRWFQLRRDLLDSVFGRSAIGRLSFRALVRVSEHVGLLSASAELMDSDSDLASEYLGPASSPSSSCFYETEE